MGVLDSAQDMIGKGASVVKGAVSGVAVENQAFMRGFIRMCNDGWLQGWHERNGGNLTYRMTEAEVEAARPFFYDNPSSWVAMGVQADNLRGAYFVTTGAGRYMRNVQLDPAFNVGIVQINNAGDACPDEGHAPRCARHHPCALESHDRMRHVVPSGCWRYRNDGAWRN